MLVFTNYTKQQGLSLIEVVFATTVIALVMTALMSVLTLSVFNQAQSRYQQQAGSFAQEALEVFRRERAILGWQVFVDSLSNGTYCLNSLPADSSAFQALSPGECEVTEFLDQPGVGTQYQRQITVAIDGSSNSVTLTSEVGWLAGDDQRQVTVEQVFRPIE